MREADRGSVLVPGRNRPYSDALRLSWARLRSPHPERTPVVFLAGGPGDSGIGWLDHPPFRAVFDRAAQTRDVVLLDQRGCGESEQDTRCEPPDFRAGWMRDSETAFGMLAEQARRTLDAKPDLRPDYYTPWSSAQDLAIVADSLGVERVHLWGYSYGTHLAQAALKAIPERIDRTVLCGFEGPDQTYKLPSYTQAQIERLAELARRQDICDDLCGVMADVHAKLDASPARVKMPDGQTVEVGQFGIQWMVSTWVGVSNRFRNLPGLYVSLATSDTGPLEKAVHGFAKMLSQRRAVFYLKDAASGATAARLRQIADEAPGCLLGDAANFPFPAIREAWRQVDLGDDFRRPLQTEKPLFILTGSMDGFTPTENAQESLGLLPNAIHAEIENAAHNDLLSCPEAVRDIIRFFEEEDVAPAGYSIPPPQVVGASNA